jgi:protein-tyrosine phosphatase
MGLPLFKRSAPFMRTCTIFFLVLVFPLLALDDEERQETFRSIISQKEALIPQHIRDWINHQVIQLDRFDKTHAHLDKGKILGVLHKAERYLKGTKIRADKRPNKSVGKPRKKGLKTKNFGINANDVLTPEQAYLVTELPSERAENNFWKAVIQSEVKTIVALVTPHREAYWNDSRFPKTVGNYKITKISENEMGTSPFFRQHKIIWRKFGITHKDGSWVRTINQFQYENWPDHDAPEDTLFRQFLQLVEKHHSKGSVPILVHCAAGIGRSGTFVAAHSLRKEVRKLRRRDGPHFINVPKRILELRIQRGRMLSRVTQLGAVIEAVRDSVFQHYLTQAEKGL